MSYEKVFLEELPKKGDRINWKESIGYKVPFVYDDIEGEIEIIDYLVNNKKLMIAYDINKINIGTGNFQKCKIGKILMKITNDFKINVGEKFIDEKRYLTIIDKKYKKSGKWKQKYYKYHCNKCGNEDWIEESKLISEKRGCNTCCSSPRKVVLGINTIWDTDRWMVDLGVSEEDAKRYSRCSQRKIVIKCPFCRRKKKMKIGSIYNYKSIGCSCGDGKSYPEKFMRSLLDQLNVDFEIEYSPSWIDNKRYDFYIKECNCIIEVHGKQHYDGSFKVKGGRTLEEEKQNDKHKKEVALLNGIKYYIELDCRESNMDYIKNSIINSELANLFDLSNINWTSCAKFSNKNIVKEVCNHWNNRSGDEMVGDLAKVFNLDRCTINRYLKKGTKLGWCDYDPRKEKIKSALKNSSLCKKKVEIFKDNQSLGVFESYKELAKQSEELFGVKLLSQNISSVCAGEVRFL